MPRPLRLIYPGAKYHITSRGNGRQRVFLESDDYERFLEQLDAALEEDEVLLYAYALMPNHYHLFIETPLGNVKRFMQRLNTAYGMYFRYKHTRPGHCFQGRYGAKLVEGEGYILGLTRYIHLNPVKVRSLDGASDAEKRRLLRGFKWSSYSGYTDKKEAEERVVYRWLELMGARSRIRNRRAYEAFVQTAVGKKDVELLTAMKASRYVIGDEREREKAAEAAKAFELSRYCRDVEWPEPEVIELAMIEEAVALAFKISVTDLHFHGRRTQEAKSVAIELCCQLSGKTQRDIGEYFGYGSESSVGKQRGRLREKLEQNKKLKSRMNKLKKSLLGT